MHINNHKQMHFSQIDVAISKKLNPNIVTQAIYIFYDLFLDLCPPFSIVA
jgi:hypothetical protein